MSDMAVKIVPTFTATIYVGTYWRAGGITHSPDRIIEWIRRYCDVVGLCVSVTPTQFIYTRGSEPGLIIGMINYPRFPASPDAIRKQALEIAEQLRVEMMQERVSVVFPDETVMIGGEPE